MCEFCQIFLHHNAPLEKCFSLERGNDTTLTTTHSCPIIKHQREMLMGNSLWKRVKKNGGAYLFIGVPVLIFAVFTLLPLLMAFLNSFLEYVFLPGRGMTPVWVGLRNFSQVFADSTFKTALKITFIWSVVFIPVGGVVIPLVLAVLVQRFGKGWRIFFRSAYYLPGVVSGVILSMVWLWIFNPSFGLLNFLITPAAKVIAPDVVGKVNWLGDPRLALPSLLLMVLAGGGGAGMIIYLTGMDDIPRDIYEAAVVDGASPWKVFTKITVPLLRPVTLFLLITSTIASFQVFTQIYVMTQGGPSGATTTMVYLIYNEAFVNSKFGVASAEALILFFIIAIFSVIEFKLLSTDVEY
jgi:multiple sugar transport system permease protein